MIYIDGSHHGEQVFRDAKNCFDCLKLNGIMIFDDFLKEYYNEKHENTIGGVLNFIQKYKDKINIEFVHYQIFLKKNITDLFKKFNYQLSHIFFYNILKYALSPV